MMIKKGIFICSILLLSFGPLLNGQDILTESTEVYSVCMGDCVEIGIETDFCYFWLDNSGTVLENQNNIQNICPDQDEVYFFNITDDEGNISRAIEYSLVISDENNPETIYRYFLEDDFLPIPYIDIVEAAVQGPSNSISQSSCVTDYASLTIDFIPPPEIGTGLTGVDLSSYLTSNYCSDEIQYFITSNDQFCDNDDLISSVREEFYNCNKYSVWFHILEYSSFEEGYNDVLFFKTNEDFILECGSLSAPETIEYPQWNVFAGQHSTDNYSGTEYTVVHQSFAPWIDFGSLNLGQLLSISENNFLGDDRGFSLNDYVANATSTMDLSSSRLYNRSVFRLDEDGLVDFDRGSSGTYGNWNFIKPPVTNYVPERVIPEDVQLPNGPCDFMEACFRVSRIEGPQSFSNNTLYVHNFGRDECVSASPNIDMRSRLVFDIVEDEGKEWLSIRGIALNKGFPSHEIYIEDSEGKRVFIATNPTSRESNIAVGLGVPYYDGINHVNLLIELDESGDGTFADQIQEGIIVNNIGSVSLNSGTGLITTNNVVTLRHNPFQITIDFIHVNTSISYWNNILNGSKNPALDCLSISCCGNLGCCQ